MAKKKTDPADKLAAEASQEQDVPPAAFAPATGQASETSQASSPAPADLEQDVSDAGQAASDATPGANFKEAITAALKVIAADLGIPPSVALAPAEVRGLAEIRAATPSELTEAELEADLADLEQLPAQRAEITRRYADAVHDRDAELKLMNHKINLLTDERRRFEEHYATLGERLRLLREEKKRRVTAAERAAEQAAAKV